MQTLGKKLLVFVTGRDREKTVCLAQMSCFPPPEFQIKVLDATPHIQRPTLLCLLPVPTHPLFLRTPAMALLTQLPHELPSGHTQKHRASFSWVP